MARGQGRKVFSLVITRIIVLFAVLELAYAWAMKKYKVLI